MRSASLKQLIDSREVRTKFSKVGLSADAVAVAILNDDAAAFFCKCDRRLLLDSAISIALKYMRAFLCGFPRARTFGFAIAFTKDDE